MGRSPYDPAPSYAICRYCGGEYDDSGYYGTADESHFCREKARAALRLIVQRFPDADRLLQEVASELVQESRAAQEERALREIARLEALLAEKRDEVAGVERALADRRSEAAVSRPASNPRAGGGR